MIKKSIALLSIVAIGAGTVFADPITDTAPIPISLLGNTSYDGWANLTSANYPGYPSPTPFTPPFNSDAAWPSPIGSNLPGSGDATLNKVSGYGNPATAAIYAFDAGYFSITDTTPVANLKTIALQVQIGEAVGKDFLTGNMPTLTYNGSETANLILTQSRVLAQAQNGTFPNPETGDDEPIYINLWLFQWDLSGVTDPIASFQINWGVSIHTQMYGFQLDQSDTFSTIPEPSSVFMALGGLGAFGLLRWRMIRRRR